MTKNDTKDDEVWTCGYCGRPIDSVDFDPGRVDDGDCLWPEKEIRVDGTEYIIGMRVIRHDETKS